VRLCLINAPSRSSHLQPYQQKLLIGLPNYHCEYQHTERDYLGTVVPGTLFEHHRSI
jgi:hypothetical protein